MKLPDQCDTPEEWSRSMREVLQGAVLPGGLRVFLLRYLGVLDALLLARRPAVVGRRPLSKRQAEIYQFIETHIGEQGFAPSHEEIAAQFGLQSLATVHEHLKTLEGKGWIRREYNSSRAITLVGAPLIPRETLLETAEQRAGGGYDRDRDNPLPGGEHS